MDGRKDDQEKTRWDLLPWEQVEEIARVLTLGAVKYDDENWKKVPDAEKRYFAALHRHLVAYRAGKTADPESGLSHLSHAACCILFLAWFEKRKKESTAESARLTEAIRARVKGDAYKPKQGDKKENQDDA